MRPVVALLGSVPTVAVILASCADGGETQLQGTPDAGVSGDTPDGAPADNVPLFLDASFSDACAGAQSCAAAGAECGPIGDGCGGVLQCGSCTLPQSCGGGGTPSVCGGAGCVPATCASLGVSCGPAGDGCGGLLACGTCPAALACGGGGTPSVCGGTSHCVPRTCASSDCGPIADGCGGLLQCATCTAPSICGGGGTPSVCGGAPDGGTCTNLCLQQVACDGGATTTVSGTVFAPNGVDPLYNALVYVPNAPVAAFPPGVACEQCGAQASGSPLVSVVTGPDGTFQLQNVPVGSAIPLVIQIGRWRRQVVIPAVAACTDTAVPASLTRLPQNHGEGDIPLMAFATGAVDALECVLRKIGVDDAEFTLPASLGGAGRINLYVSNGADVGSATPPATDLYDTLSAISAYDMVLFPCEGGQIDKTTTAQQNLVQYANAGGRVFTTHYSYTWLYTTPPFWGTANFIVNQAPLPDLTGHINVSFAKGADLATWLVDVGASTTSGLIPLQTIRHDVDGVIAPSQLWISADPAVSATATMHYTFDTPVGAPASQQCGRVLFDDFHVEDAQTSGLTFPAECQAGPMTPQEKLLEFMLFDLASCITPPGPPPPPMCTTTTCAAQNLQCGPAGDGCGGTLQCGSCVAPLTCGGGGTPGVCGGCTPTTCTALGIACGPAGDGCGGTLQCGVCGAGETCGGPGMPGVCVPQTCVPGTCQPASCGPVADGCGGLLQCGTCTDPATCGGGGMASVCGTIRGN
jgi:hypothetical protein